jgi:hypothetical protein
VPLVLLGIIRDSCAAGTLRPAGNGPAPSAVLTAQAETLTASVEMQLPAPVTTRALIAWTQLFGMISVELFGQLVGSVDPSDEFFDHATEQMARFVGL